jgi:hypothetical protein
MAVVYRARQLSLNRLVALKILPADEYTAPADLVRFLGEAETVAALHHPNVVQVFESGRHEGQLFFSMELLPGGTLAQQIRGVPQLPHTAAGMTETLARAIQAAHERGIIHRDLKPANVLLTADGQPRIADFGLAKRLQGGPGLTQSGAVVGTPSYMAPEQAGGVTRQLGPAADVWALGATLYEMLTGQPPFRADSPFDTVFQVLTQEPKRPRVLRPETPRELETICLKCLEKKPARRYASAAALADDLRRFLEGRPIQARPTGIGRRLTKWARRRPAVATVLLLLVCLGVAGILLWWQGAEARKKSLQAQIEAADRLIGRAEKYQPYAGARSPAVEDLLADVDDVLQKLLQSREESQAVLERQAQLEYTSADLERRLNRSGAALTRAQRARGLYEHLHARDPDNRGWQDGLARCDQRMAAILWRQGQLGEALKRCRQAEDWWRRRLAQDDPPPQAQRQLAGCLLEIGRTLAFYRGEDEGALKALREAVELYERLARTEPANAERQADYAHSLCLLGDLITQASGDAIKAQELVRTALGILEARKGPNVPDDDWERGRAECLIALAGVLAQAGQGAEARQRYEEARQLACRYADEYPRDLWWQRLAVSARFFQAQLLDGWTDLPRKLADAVGAGEEVDALLKSLQEADPENADWQDMRCLNRLVVGLCRAGLAGLEESREKNLAGALTSLQQARALAQDLVKRDRSHYFRRRRVIHIYGILGEVCTILGKEAEAAEQRRLGTILSDELARDNANAAPRPRSARPAGPVALSAWLVGWRILQLCARPKIRQARAALAQAEQQYQHRPTSQQTRDVLVERCLALRDALVEGATREGQAVARQVLIRGQRLLRGRPEKAPPGGPPAAPPAG